MSCECGRYDEGDAPSYPCYDPRTDAICIRKSSGWGMNINLATTGGKLLTGAFLLVIVACFIVGIVFLVK